MEVHSKTNMATKIKLKRGLRINVPILEVGEVAVTLDTREFVIGGENSENIFIPDSEAVQGYIATTLQYKNDARQYALDALESEQSARDSSNHVDSVATQVTTNRNEASTFANNASASATTATTKATTATTKASEATTQANIALAKATESSGHVTTALGHANTALQAKNDALVVAERLNRAQTYRSVVATSNVYTLDVSTSDNFLIETTNTTAKSIVFSNVPQTNNSIITVAVQLKFTSNAVITYPSSVKWAVPPSFVVGKTYTLLFMTWDKGVTWQASCTGGW